MRYVERRLEIWLLVLILICAAAGAALSSADPSFHRQSSYSDLSIAGVEAAIASWPETAREVAGAMLARYGVPDRITPDALYWLERGPWRTTTVHRDDDFARRGGVLEQSLSYVNAQGRWWALNELGLGVVYDAKVQVLSSAAESEAANILALNLAVEVATDRRTPQDARAFYRRTLDLSLSGKSSAYTRGLLFTPVPRPLRIWPYFFIHSVN
jgi:hypothetical protein